MKECINIYLQYAQICSNMYSVPYTLTCKALHPSYDCLTNFNRIESKDHKCYPFGKYKILWLLDTSSHHSVYDN